MPFNDLPRDRLVELGRAAQPMAVAGKQAKAAARHIELLKLVENMSMEAAISHVESTYDIGRSGARSRIYRAQAWLEKQ